jgi:hypothetical protein
VTGTPVSASFQLSVLVMATTHNVMYANALIFIGALASVSVIAPEPARHAVAVRSATGTLSPPVHIPRVS